MPTLTRLIQSYGVLRPPEESYQSRRFVLRCDVLRNPLSPYVSRKTQPDVSFYGYLTIIRDGYVVDKVAIEYEHQELYSQDVLTELLNYERLWRCRFPDGINFLKGLISGTASDFSLLPTGVFTTLRPNVDEFRVRLLTEDVQVKLTLLWEPLFECLGDNAEQDEPPPEIPPLIPDGEEDPLLWDDSTFDEVINDPYDGISDDDRTFDNGVEVRPGCWKTFTTYTGLSPTTDYTYGLSTDEPAYRVTPGVPQWEMYDSITGRTMRNNIVGTASTPTLVSAIWQEVCEVPDIFGIPPT